MYKKDGKGAYLSISGLRRKWERKGDGKRKQEVKGQGRNKRKEGRGEGGRGKGNLLRNSHKFWLWNQWYIFEG